MDTALEDGAMMQSFVEGFSEGDLEIVGRANLGVEQGKMDLFAIDLVLERGNEEYGEAART